MNGFLVKSFDDFDIYFKGDIYNITELINKHTLVLEKNNELFLLKILYEMFSYDFLNSLNGIFAFCIYDKKKKLYFCARDKFGNIPFFYHLKNDKFLFSTSQNEILKKLENLPNLNKVALSKYMQYFSSFGEDTFYSGISKLEEASFLIHEDGKDFVKKRYYKINTYKSIKDEEIALKSIEELLIASIEQRIQNNPACLLSGGVDSSIISAIYSKISGKKIDTYSVGYSDFKNYCELDFAQITANHINSNHHPLYINQKEYINAFYETLDALEEPHGDSAAIPLNLLFKQINKDGVNSLLSGEGSDEIFMGYETYSKFLKYYEFEKSLSKEQNLFLDEIIISLQNNTKESEYLRRIVKKQNLYNSFGEIYTDIQKRKLFKNVPSFKSEKPKQNPVDWMSYIDLKIWLGNALLMKVHKIASANSLQVSTPFLDSNLVNYLYSIDSDIKMGNTNKYLLKKIALKYIPEKIVNRTKKGFNSPFNEWLHLEFKDSILETILDVNKCTKLFNEEYIKHIYELSKANKFKQHLYSLFVFSLWYKKVYLS